jgi:Peptidase family C25
MAPWLFPRSRACRWGRVWLALALCTIGGARAARAAAPVIGTSTAGDPMNAAHMRYTHWANGYYWVAFDNGGIGCSFYSSPDGATWTSLGTIFATLNPNSYNNEWAMRFLGNTVIVAGFNSPNRIYRSGTLDSNGTVTWSAESAAGPADATLNSLNVLIANGRPIMWRDDATAGGAGAIWRGSAIAGPTWTKTAANAPAMSTGGVSNGIFTAGALFQTGGANPDDLIVLRSTTVTPYAAGNHRLVAMKWNAATDTYDASWYNVSTLGGTLTEDLTTEVQVNDDNTNQKRFTAVRDSSGNIHSVYVNRNGDMVHYKKAVGFNNSWSRISAGINPPAENINMVSLTAAAGGYLYLFYSKGDRRIYYRRFDGTAWGTESLLQDVSATSLRGSLAPMESAGGCSVGLAFIEGTASPYNIRFTLGAGDCSTLQTTQGATTITVTDPGSFEMRFNASTGGGIDQFYDLAEDPTRTYDLAGGTTNHQPLLLEEMNSGGSWYESGRGGAQGQKLELLEATPTRTRVRAEAFLKTTTTFLPGLKAVGDYSVYPSGRTALRWSRSTTVNVAYTDDEVVDLVVHYQGAGVLSNWATYSESGLLPPNQVGGNKAFLLSQIEQPGARTDFLAIRYQDWGLANRIVTLLTPAEESLQVWWDTNTASSYPAGFSDTASVLLYFKPTSFLNNTDPAVISRSTDYRAPATPTINAGKGSQWQDAAENTGTLGDFYNESEAAYVFNLDPTNGLDFNLDGTTTTRYSPFFKIRQWRSAVAPSTITVDGVTRTRDVHYRADVKPLARGHYEYDIRFHSTLQSAAAVTSPDIGAAGVVAGAPTFAAARYGSGVTIANSGQYVAFATAGGLIKPRGTVEFWFQPAFDSGDGVLHDICGFVTDVNNLFVLEKRADNALYFQIMASGTSSELMVSSANFSWRTNDWVHIRLQWDESNPQATQLRLFLNGTEPTHTDPAASYSSAALTTAAQFRFGNANGDATFAPGVYDEVYSYEGTATANDTIPLAAGGLTADANEYLADPTRNRALRFNGGGDGMNRTTYLLLGSDSPFRGLNVVLSTAGAGVAAGAMLWEYWNGTTGAWANLKTVGGFTDQTNSFARNGTVFWTSDPPNWAPYSVNGGPDLYSVRAHLPAGSSYSTAPVESVIKTDIVLFQYCADVTTNSNFVFTPPVPTAVRLMSFSAVPGDGSVTLEWRTGSELDNLGFHVHRGSSAEGPWTRLTSSPIPGLGSSALGQAYSWLDSGLTNGVRYYYRLEDVDTSSKSTFHGPVSATPEAPASPPPGGGVGAGGGGEPGNGGGAHGDSTCPSWVLAAAPGAVAPWCTRYGDPESVALDVVSRDASSATLELWTGGFWALHTRDADDLSGASEVSGTVRAFVPGLEFPSDAKAPALPLRRVLVDAVVGKGVQLVSVEASDLRTFRGLRPAAVGAAEIRVGRDGTVRPARRALADPLLSRGYVPAEAARLAGTVFQGERKSAVVEIVPVRFSGSRGELVLAGRVRVRLAFAGVAEGEVGTGSRGRALPGKRAPFRDVLAQLHTAQRGLYAVRYEQLFPLRPRGFSTLFLRLERQGEAVPFHVEPSGSVFGPGSVLYFFADRTASSTDYSSEVAYELVRTSGVRMGVVTGAPAGGPVGSFSTGLASFETNRIYQPGLLEAPDLWLWEAMPSGVAKTEPFALSGVATGSEWAASLEVLVQGGSDSVETSEDHHVRVSLNGVDVGEASFGGKRPYRLSATVPTSLLREGTNELSMVNVGDTGVSSLVFLDRFEVSYPQVSSASRGVFEGVWGESGAVEVSGLPSRPIVLDVTAAARWVTGFETMGSSVRFQAEAGHRYLVASGEGALSPRVGRVALSTLREASNQADYLVIAPAEFLGAAGPLLERRQGEGLSSRAVSFEEIASEFGQGQPSAEAIKKFLSYAWRTWRRPSPRYVLLLGDATYDPRHFLSPSWASPLPALWAKTSYLWTVSDPALAAVNGEDLLPDLAIGRLPAATVEQAEALVGKLLAWEDSGQGLSGNAVFVADDPDAAGDFEADVEDVRASFLEGRPTETLRVRELGSETRPAILDAFDEGASLMSYVGHGGSAVWASENVLNSWDVPSLRAQSRQPLLLTMNCLNGYFVAPNFDSLPEAFLKAEGRGAIAAFSPSGLSLDGPAHEYHRAVMAELASGAHERLGDAVIAAQRAYAETGLMPELLTVYQLLGDPALRIR